MVLHNGTMHRDLSDEEWRAIAPVLPKARRRARADDRRILNAILYIVCTGRPWRDLPKQYGPYTTAYNRFNRWARRRYWQQIAECLGAVRPDHAPAIDALIGGAAVISTVRSRSESLVQRSTVEGYLPRPPQARAIMQTQAPTSDRTGY